MVFSRKHGVSGPLGTEYGVRSTGGAKPNAGLSRQDFPRPRCKFGIRRVRGGEKGDVLVLESVRGIAEGGRRGKEGYGCVCVCVCV